MEGIRDIYIRMAVYTLQKSVAAIMLQCERTVY